MIETFSNPQQGWGESCTQVAANKATKHKSDEMAYAVPERHAWHLAEASHKQPGLWRTANPAADILGAYQML